MKKLSNDIVDQRLKEKNRPIKRISEYKSSPKKMKWQCLKCDHLWEAAFQNIYCGKNGCPKCSKRLRLTNEIVDQRLKEAGINIERIDEYKNLNTSMKWRCKNCNHIWKTAFTNIFHHRTRCPSCIGKLPLTNETVDKRLKNRKIKRLGDFVNCSTKIKWQCLECDYVWEARPNDVVNAPAP